jgi:hypothetical protein
MSASVLEMLDRRVLGALRFVDCLGAPVRSQLAIAAPEGVVVWRKPSGVVVIAAAPGLAAHAGAFLAPAAPAPGSVRLDLDVRPADAGLDARRVRLSLPRDADPARAEAADSLFRAQDVTLLPAPGARPAGMAALLYVTIVRAADGRRIENALVRFRPDGGRPVARARSDAAGTALLVVPGVPLASPGAGAVVTHALGGALDAIADPALARFHAEEEIGAARRRQAARRRDFLDPDEVEARLGDAAMPAGRAGVIAGRALSATISWSPP